MKQMSRDPSAVSKARRAEAKDSLIKIKPLSSSSAPSSGTGASSSAGKAGGSGFKKGGFKNAFAPAGKEEVVVDADVQIEKGDDGVGGRGEGTKAEVEVEAETDQSGTDDDGLEEGERYDPRRPTGCWDGCPGRRAKV